MQKSAITKDELKKAPSINEIIAEVPEWRMMVRFDSSACVPLAATGITAHTSAF